MVLSVGREHGRGVEPLLVFEKGRLRLQGAHPGSVLLLGESNGMEVRRGGSRVLGVRGRIGGGQAGPQILDRDGAEPSLE